MADQFPAGWHPDPFSRYEHRYWDGNRWSEHVATGGRQTVDPPVQAEHRPAVKQNRKVQRQLRKMGVPNTQPGGGTLFTEPVLVFNQKARFVEVNAEYAIYDQRGVEIGVVREVGQTFRKRPRSRISHTRSHTFEVVDNRGQVLLRLSRPAKVMRSKMSVFRGDGETVGQIAQRTIDIASVLGFHTNFTLESGGEPVGSMRSESEHGWECAVYDTEGNQVAQITRSWAGLTKEMFTKADHYVLRFHRPLEDPLLSLVVSGAVAVDVALRQR